MPPRKKERERLCSTHLACVDSSICTVYIYCVHRRKKEKQRERERGGEKEREK